MSVIDSTNSLDSRMNEGIFDRRSLKTDFDTPKIAASVSFNHLNKKAIPRNSKSPYSRKVHESLNHAITPHPLPSKKVEGVLNKHNTEEDMHNTWKKAPKISKELPSAFGGSFQRSLITSRSKAQRIILKLARSASSNPFQIETEPVQNIEKMPEPKDSKTQGGILSPLKKKPKPSQPEEFNHDPKDKSDKKKPRNPLLPLKNYLILTKLNEEFKDKGDIAVQKLEKVYKMRKDSYTVTKPDTTHLPPKLNEMITISVMKSSHETGTVKKVIDAATMKLLAVKVQFNKFYLFFRKSLSRPEKQEITSKTGSRCENHVKIYSTVFNVPEGHLSIIMELMRGGSLHNLLESCGTLPEQIIKNIGSQAVAAIHELHDKTNTAHGAISPSQILISKEGHIKVPILEWPHQFQLSLGLFQRLHHLQGTGYMLHTLGKNVFDKISLYELTPLNNPSSFQKQISSVKDLNIDNKHAALAQDVFDFGFMMLICAVGGLELFEASDFVEKLKVLIEELHKKPGERHKYCCLLHDEDKISSIKLPSPESTFQNKPVRVQKSNGIVLDRNSKGAEISIQDFLKASKFSREFIDLLCSCLKFDPIKRATTREILNSPFFKIKDTVGPVISLTELLKISHQWSKNAVLPPEYQGASERQLEKLMEALAVVLPSCERFATSDENIRDYSEIESLLVNSPEIQDLAADLGIPAVTVWRKLQIVLKSIDENK